MEVEQAMIDAGERVAAGLRRNLRVLNTIHTVGPLLGLLGTVLGIIRCFDKIARQLSIFPALTLRATSTGSIFRQGRNKLAPTLLKPQWVGAG